MTDTLTASPAAASGRAPAVPDPPCTRCGGVPARLYAQGRRCAAHTPAALAGLPEPSGGYCAPNRHYCPTEQRCATWAAQKPEGCHMPYRALITGSRTWANEQAIRDALAAIISQHGPEQVTVVHGACPNGADAIADRIAQAWTGVTVERHPADWTGPAKRGAGYARNAHMVQLGAQICLAFIDPCTGPKCRTAGPHGTHGATHCARLAHRAGIEVRRWPR